MSTGTDAIESRIDELIAELTPAEKAGQLTSTSTLDS